MKLDLSKAFDYNPHDFLIAKFSAYGFDILKYIYSYLKIRKQCVRINNVCSGFEEIISRVPQGSIVDQFCCVLFLTTSFT